jgi:hypothetical protein
MQHPAKRNYCTVCPQREFGQGTARENDRQTASLVIDDKALFELLGSLY